MSDPSRRTRIPAARASAPAPGAVPGVGSPVPRPAFALLLALASVGVPSALAAQQPAAPPGIRGFSAAAAEHEREAEALLASVLDADSVGRHFRHLTAEPHPAGSERNRELARYVADRFRAYGLEEVRIRRYEVLLPWPEEVSVSMLAPRERELSLVEDGLEEDADSFADVGPAYLGMSASGDATGDLVYANSGNPEDYDWLEAQGVDLRGKVALVRYSVPYSYRGFKALTAERRGLAALLVYSDPEEDGYRKGLVYPEGPWGPESHIQRGSITYDFRVPGDPLTPGWASVEGARRIPVEEAVSVPGIVAVPLSWREALPLLEGLGGPVAPPAWQGALPLAYRVGPGATRVRVRVRMDGRTRPIQVVEGRVTGAERPDRTVVLGNHRDAWVYGGVDPSSGTATQLELARALGALARAGHRPRRTIVLASWDAEEWHLTGSTEWGEELAERLRGGAVGYLNVDYSTSGPHFGAGAVASLNRLVVETVRDVEDPGRPGSVLEAWRRDRSGGGPDAVIGGGAAAEEGAAGAAGDLALVGNRLGSGSDYTVFLNFLGIPIVEMSFDGPYGVYHSIYDSYAWVSRFGDPGLRYMTAMGEVWGRMALRLANAEVLPYDFRLYADRVGAFLDDLSAVPGVAERLDLGAARAAAADWARNAERLEARLAAFLGSAARASAGTAASPGAAAAPGAEASNGADAAGRPGASGAAAAAGLGPLNDALLGIERLLLLEEGIPGRPWFRHALYAPRPTYAAVTLPGVTEAAEAGSWGTARRQLALLAERLAAVAEALARAAELVPPAPAVGVGGTP